MNTHSKKDEQEESFRDHFSSVDDYGKRVWFYPQKPKGKWHTRRVFFTIVLLSLMFAAPFIRIDGHPAFLFNILERKFIVFGLYIGPQDYWIFGLMMLSFLVFVTLFTNMFGRLWCGWACPQTVFMEMVFRKIEYAIEGDWNKQKALDRAPWDASKIFKKTLKWSIFLVISFLIANLLLSYVLGVDELKKIIIEPLADHIGLFSGIVGFTLVFFFVFAWLRDQACTVVCPYGRLQGVLMDKKSVVVAYDHQRGEPRGKLHKNQERTEGDCISCLQCVRVCPTGIDIRNGTQMECVNCTACIDACDHIMDQIGFDRGLIRYTSEERIVDKSQKKTPARVYAYSVILTLLLAALSYSLISRKDTETTFLRVPGSRYIENNDGTVSNLYTYKMFNKTNRTIVPEMKLSNIRATLKFAGNDHPELAPAAMIQGSVIITVPRSELTTRKTNLKFVVFEKDKKLESFETTFLSPE